MSRVVPAAGRYELLGDDGERVGLLRFEDDGDVVDLVHTEVDEQQQGGGLGAELVAGALDDLRAKRRRIRPSCPFVAAYVRRHPEYADLVAQ